MRTAPVLLFIILAVVLQVQAAGPRVIMVHGGSLAEPVVMDNWQENIDLLHATANDAAISSKDLANRFFLELELFSGSYWVRYMEANNGHDGLRPESAEQHARFYPAVGEKPAIITYEFGLPRRVEPNGLAILRRNGIPVSLQAGPSSTANLCLLVAISLLIVFAAWRVSKYDGQLLKEN